jgi:serine/threonine protein kinase
VSDHVPVPPALRGPPRGERDELVAGPRPLDPIRHRQFKVHYCLGRGGYGEVYRATMTSPGGLKAEVAVKLLRLDVNANDDAVRRLRDEGRMLGLLQHPAILKVYDLAVLDGRVGLVTEYVDGADILALFGSLPQRALVEVIARIAEGLDAAWNHVPSEGQGPLRLVHRDIKPSNIRLGRHGEVKILDFGIARSTAEGADREARTGTGSTVGSLAYMAPERFTRAPPSPASDVHALGCVLYEGLAGRRLFEDPVPVEMFRLAADPLAYAEHVEQAWQALPDLTPALSNLIAQMVAHGPNDRPTALEVRRLAEEVADRLPGSSLRTWVRDFEWPKPTPVQGGWFDGRTITEGSQSDTHVQAIVPGIDDDRSSDTFRIEVPGHTPPAAMPRPAAAPPPRALGTPPEAPPDRRAWLAAALALPPLLLVVAALAWWALGDAPRPPRPPVPAPLAQTGPETPPEPRPTPRPEPTPAPQPTPLPDPGRPHPPTPARPAPQPAPEPAPEPAPVAPDPVAPVPEPPPVGRGRVKVVNAPARIELRRGDQVVALPGTVDAAPDWQVWADFGTGMHKLQVYVPVQADLDTVVRCNRVTYDCDVD